MVQIPEKIRGTETKELVNELKKLKADIKTLNLLNTEEYYIEERKEKIAEQLENMRISGAHNSAEEAKKGEAHALDEGKKIAFKAKRTAYLIELELMDRKRQGRL